MTFSDDCFALVKASEGCELHAYCDSVGVLTIGWGHTGKDVMADSRWTQAQADAQLAADLETACEQVQKLVTVPLTQGQLDALTDFVFNMGAERLKDSTLLKLLNMGHYDSACTQLYWLDGNNNPHGWIYAGGKILPGLVTRRQKEQALWNKQGAA